MTSGAHIAVERIYVIVVIVAISTRVRRSTSAKLRALVSNTAGSALVYIGKTSCNAVGALGARVLRR